MSVLDAVALSEEEAVIAMELLYGETPWQHARPDVPHDYWAICKCCGVREIGETKLTNTYSFVPISEFDLLMQWDRAAPAAEPPTGRREFRIEDTDGRPALTLYWKPA